MRCDQKDERGIAMGKLQFKCQNLCEPVEVVEKINDDPLPFLVVLLMVHVHERKPRYTKTNPKFLNSDKNATAT